MTLFNNRFVTFIAVIRVNSIEVTRSRAIGSDEAERNTPQRVQAVSDAFRAGAPNGKMTWALSWLALFDESENFQRIHALVKQLHDTYGDEVTFTPGGYFANVYNTREEINRDVHDALGRISQIVGNNYRPASIVAGMFPAQCQKYLVENEAIHVCQGNIFSQYAIDNGSDDGSICYPYYTSTEHMLKPAQGTEDFIDCVNLDGWTVDFLAARYVGYECGNSRMGVGPIESIGAFGPEIGVKQMVATTAMHFDSGFSLNNFGFVTVVWEICLDPAWDAGLTDWLTQTGTRWPATKAVTVGEFGLTWRHQFKDNTSIDYRFKTRGTGIGRGSEENLEISWFMNQDFRLALLRNVNSTAEPDVIDYTRYDIEATEPQAIDIPDWSLMNVLNMKRTRPHDTPMEFSKLPDAEQRKIIARYPQLASEASHE